MRHLNTLILIAAVFASTPLALALQAKKAGSQQPDSGASVTLTRRKGDGPYGPCAFSFRYATQDVERHQNDVDIVFNGCGLLHIAPNGGSKNRVAKSSAKSISDVKELPSEGWNTSAFSPVKGAVYVMEIDDGSMRMLVRFRVTSVSDGEVRFEWAPFRDPALGTSGTLGQCGGKHEPS